MKKKFPTVVLIEFLFDLAFFPIPISFFHIIGSWHRVGERENFSGADVFGDLLLRGSMTLGMSGIFPNINFHIHSLGTVTASLLQRVCRTTQVNNECTHLPSSFPILSILANFITALFMLLSVKLCKLS